MVKVQKLFEYDAKVRRRFLEALSKLPWEELLKNREASFHSIRDIILHSVEVEDRLLHFVQGKKNEWVDYDFSKFNDMKSIYDQVEKVETRTKTFFKSLKDEDLDRIAEFPRRDGTLYLRVEDMLIQSITEQLYHRGEIIALMWQMNIEPPRMHWIFNLPTETRSAEKH